MRLEIPIREGAAPRLDPSCHQQALIQGARNYYGWVLGSCGAVEKVWTEGNAVLNNVTIADMQGEAEIIQDSQDSCQTERRVRLFQSAAAAVDRVDTAVQTEAKRIQGICGSDRARFRSWAQGRSHVCASPLQGAEAFEREVQKLDQELGKVLKEAEELEKAFEERVARARSSYASLQAKALACANSIRPPNDPIGDFLRQDQGSGGSKTNSSQVPVPRPRPAR